MVGYSLGFIIYDKVFINSRGCKHARCSKLVCRMIEPYINCCVLLLSADVYLAGTVMLIFGMGLYGLFISNTSTDVPSESDRALQGSSLFGMFALKVANHLFFLKKKKRTQQLLVLYYSRRETMYRN